MKAIINFVKTEALRLGFYCITTLIAILGAIACAEMERQGIGTNMVICTLNDVPVNLPDLVLLASIVITSLLTTVEFIAFRVEDILWIKRKIFK